MLFRQIVLATALVSCTSTATESAMYQSVPSPLEVFFEGSDQEALAADLHIQFEDVMTVCLQRSGFEYVQRTYAPSQENINAQYGTRQYAESDGYGLVTKMLSTPAAAEDPNLDYVIGLTDAEYHSYQVALVGPELADKAFITGDEGVPLEQQGCYGEALIETDNGEKLLRWSEFSLSRKEALEALTALPSMISAAELWSACMFAEGHQFGDQSEVYVYISNQLTQATGSSGEALSGISDEEVAAFLDGQSVDLGEGTESEIEQRFVEILEEERDIAVADHDCYIQHVQSVFEPLRDEVELGLMDTYRPVLEDIRNG